MTQRSDTKRSTGNVKTGPAHSKAAEQSSTQLTQFTLQMRSSLHRELARKALNSGMTMRGYIMKALRDSGLKVTQADLVDRRRHL